MKFNQEPHPLIEDHYHIQDLINAQEKRSNDRIYHRERVKQTEENEKIVNEALIIESVDFWCNKCKKDIKARAYKQIEKDWNSEKKIAFYKTKCEKRHWCIRLITDKIKDGYWQKSRFVSLGRGKHFGEILQEFESGYNLMYGKSNIK